MPVPSEHFRIAIVGAGPSGLTAARQGLLYGCEVCIFEKEQSFGGVWRLAVSKNAQRRPVPLQSAMNCSKELCAFSELAIPDHLPTFLCPPDAVDYLELYVRTFTLAQHIRFGSEVKMIRRSDCWEKTGRWIVQWAENAQLNEGPVQVEELFDAVLLCTGTRLRPWRPPEYRMERKFKGTVIHSEQFTHSADFCGKTVCVVGLGNSGVALATMLAHTAEKVFLCTRRGQWVLPLLRADDEPWDCAFNSQWHFWSRQWVPKCFRNFSWEMCAKFVSNCRQSGQGPPTHRLLSANLTFGAEQLGPLLASGRIRIRPNILSLSDSNLVEFVDGTIEQHVDTVIICTGYEFDFGLVENGKTLRVMYNDFHLYKHMYAPELAPHHTLAVIGHVQPRGGCIWPIAELQARLFFHVFTGHIQLPTPFWMKAELEKRRCAVSMNMLKTRRHTQTEDFVQFMHELGAMIGAHPLPLRRLLGTDPRLGLSLLVGPCCSAQFRLVGLHSQHNIARQTIVAHQPNLFAIRHWWLIVLLIGTLLWLLFV
uniref:Flavin-containing monooxygenase n=1 Tax=Globodera rostochiensis TaxID=31243 RepID=A0A914I556_GLORO